MTAAESLTELPPFPDEEPGDDDDRDWLRSRVANRKTELRVDQLARAELAAENAPAMPPCFSGPEFLAQPDDEPAWRIMQLWPSGGNVVLAAQFKAGKTTAVHNLLRALCDGTPYLGRFTVEPPTGTVFMVDAEMPGNSARRWLSDQMIASARFSYQNIRGAAASFNILVPRIRAAWAARIAGTGASMVILDCLGPVVAALGLDESSGADIGRFLAAFEQLLAEAGIREACVVHHMGHQGERARGASRLRDWPDAEWRLVRETDDPGSPRFISAFGRDVDVSEQLLEFDKVTRSLRIAGGSRGAEKLRGAVADIAQAVTDTPGMTTRALEAAMTDTGDHTQKVARDAIRAALREKLIVRKDGDHRAKLHYPAPAAADPADTLHGKDDDDAR